MKYKAKAGDWTMTYDSESKILTMRSAERGKGFSENKTIKGPLDVTKFIHSPTAPLSVELFVYWLDRFKPCKNSRGEVYNPFADNVKEKDAITIGNALTDIYTKWKGESNGED